MDISEPHQTSMQRAEKASVSVFGNTMPDSIYNQVHQQAIQSPHANAIVNGANSITYAELDEISSQLSTHLHASGVRQGSCVIAFLSHSPLFIVAMLGVHKIGGVFVPLSSEYPDAQLQLMMEQVQAPVLLTEDACVTKCPEFSKTVINLSTLKLTSLNSTVYNPAQEYKGNCDIAFVLFTSGSTGVPKGVLQTHASYLNQAELHRDLLDYNREARVLVFGALSHGNVIVSIVSTLSTGGTVCIECYEQTIPGPALALTLQEQQISHLHLPPSSLAVLPVKHYPHLRILSVGGEMMSRHLLRAWAPLVTLFHVYGTTETNWLLVQQFNELEEDDGPIPAGCRIPNMQADVVDENGNPVPNGTVGELRAQGIGISPGYISSTTESSVKFSGHPWQSGQHWYLTGDLATQNADKQITVLGRADDQVKIRGFRVELQMVSNAIQAHPAVESVAVVIETNQHEQRLLAFIVPSAISIKPEQLRRDLRDTLPVHMIPHQIHQVRSIPLLPNGKCDRTQLLQGEWRTKMKVTDHKDEQCEINKWLLETWEEVLHTSVSTTDNFFDLGGDSLSASRVLVRIENKFDVQVTIRQFFETPTVDQIAIQIRNQIS